MANRTTRRPRLVQEVIRSSRIRLRPTTAWPACNNTQKKFDLAADASAKASQYSGGAAGGGSAESSYNQGVILFNSGKYAEAKAQFEAATKPTQHGDGPVSARDDSLQPGAHPRSGVALEAYLKVDPTVQRRPSQDALPALQGCSRNSGRAG